MMVRAERAVDLVANSELSVVHEKDGPPSPRAPRKSVWREMQKAVCWKGR